MVKAQRSVVIPYTRRHLENQLADLFFFPFFFFFFFLFKPFATEGYRRKRKERVFADEGRLGRQERGAKTTSVEKMRKAVN